MPKRKAIKKHNSVKSIRERGGPPYSLISPTIKVDNTQSMESIEPIFQTENRYSIFADCLIRDQNTETSNIKTNTKDTQRHTRYTRFINQLQTPNLYTEMSIT